MKRTILPAITAAVFLSAGLFVESGSAQVPFSQGTYSQPFDTLADSGTANAWTDNSTLPG